MNGFIKLERKLLEWEWWNDHNTTRLFIYLLLTVNWEDKKWQGTIIKRGSIVTSYYHLSINTGISIQSIRTSLTRLKSTQELTIKTTNKYTHISINNYEQYQQITSKLTNNQQTTNKQLTTTKEIKKIKKEKKKENKIMSADSFFNSLKEETNEQVVAKAKEFDVRPKDITYSAKLANSWCNGKDLESNTENYWVEFFNQWLLRGIRRHELATLSDKAEKEAEENKPKLTNEDKWILENVKII